MMKKKGKLVNFILPCEGSHPIGGFKVVFEYANRLIEKNYDVRIIFPATLLWKERKFKDKIKGIIKYTYYKINSCKYLPYNWFPLDKKIMVYWVPSLQEKYIPDADYIFATACQTAEYVEKYSIKKGKKLYLIQSYENWSMSEERLINTWKSSMKKIVISKYLKDKANSLGENAIYIENGLNFDDFYYIEKKEKNTLMMLYHSDECVKQSRKALKILIEIKEIYPQLKIILFGVGKREGNIPEWIEYYQLPTKEKLRDLYNRATIFISPSKIEGWALPPAEAMQCQTCVCVTDIPGHEYVSHLETGYKISDQLDNLREALIFLLENDELRKVLEENGYKYIQKFTWERAYLKLQNVLEKY